MKKIVCYFFMVLVLFLVGCQNNEMDSLFSDHKEEMGYEKELFDYWSKQPTGENLSLTFKRENLTLESFERTGNLWSAEEASALFQSKKQGYSPETAFALLIFDMDGKLVYNTTYWDIIENNLEVPTVRYFTDLRTFREVVGQETALPRYTKGITGHVWLYDSYQSIFRTDEEWDRILEERNKQKKQMRSTTLSAQYYVQPANVFWGKWSYDMVVRDYGHMGIVSRSPYASYSNIKTVFQNTYSIEATPPRVIETIMAEHDWISSDITMRKVLWYEEITDTQRADIVAYVKSQIGKPYYFPSDNLLVMMGDYSDKEDTERWYCSKLVWAAYRVVCGIDLDSDRGGVVFPRDIYRSSYISSVDIGLA